LIYNNFIFHFNNVKLRRFLNEKYFIIVIFFFIYITRGNFMVRAIDTIGSDQMLQSHWVYRIVAIIIDWIIVWVALVIMAFPFAMLSLYSGRNVFWGASSFFFAAVFFLYTILLESTGGGTIGKRLLRLQVITIDGSPIDISKAIIRNISKVNSILLLLDWIVGLATDGDPRQRFLDRIAGTLVIRMDVQEQLAGAYPPPPPAMPYDSRRRGTYPPPPPPPRRRPYP
jgi:uncharacterized RDD family membrane protein YckC